MGIFSRINEGLFKVRIVPKLTADDKTSYATNDDSVGEKINEAIANGRRVDLSDLLNITTLRGDRESKYKIFEEMVADGRIGAAIEMYANDTVQYNQEGKVIWVESKDPDVAKYANTLLADLNIAENIWSYAYCMWLYGDVYLELFQDTSTRGTKPTLLMEPIKVNSQVRTQKVIPGARLERYVQKVSNPADIYDLQYKGKTSGFIKNKSAISSSVEHNVYSYTGIESELNILNPTKFVHICLSPDIERFPEKFNLIRETNVDTIDANGVIDGSKIEGSGGPLAFQVKAGQSILENVYSAYQTLKLKEDSVLLERVTKSSITRIIQVELGDMPESQKKAKLREIKNQIEQQMIFNKDAGSIQSRPGAQPNENIIYTVTKDGKGTISSVNIGGDAEIGSTEDITQSENKVFGSLLTPKAALGADMDGSGLSNGGSLTELNTTYARRIKRGQIALTSGIRNLINIFALADGLGEAVVNNYEVKLTPIITVEDNRRDELLQNKIRNVNDMLSLLDNIDTIGEDARLQLIIQWLGKYLNQQEIVDILNSQIKEIEKNAEKSNIKDSTENTKNNVTSKPKIAPQSDLAEIKGDDLL